MADHTQNPQYARHTAIFVSSIIAACCLFMFTAAMMLAAKLEGNIFLQILWMTGAIHGTVIVCETIIIPIAGLWFFRYYADHILLVQEMKTFALDGVFSSVSNTSGRYMQTAMTLFTLKHLRKND